jgi:hypothetical protein
MASVNSQQQAAPVAATAAAAAVPTATAGAQQQQFWRPLPFAALSRVLLTANNSTVFRTALNKRQPVSGPMGLLLFLMTLIAASFAAIRGLLVKKGKSCKSCRGFGLSRCRLCLGSGRVDWAAKLKHFDVCPLCMNKRFIICAECGGHYHRPMFSHRRRQVGGALEPIAGERVVDEPSFEGPIMLNLAAAGAGAGSGAVLSSMND